MIKSLQKYKKIFNISSFIHTFFVILHSNSQNIVNKKRITLGDKTFEVVISEAEIQQAVDGVVARLTEDYAGKNPVFVTVLNGAFVFAADIFRRVTFPCQMAFTKVASYSGTASTGKIVEQLPVSEDLTGRHVVIIEDIVETGYSMQYLLETMKKHCPASVEICAFSYKPEQCKVDGLKVKYVGMTMPEAFIVGYGLDYDQMGRELRDIYALV